VGGSLFILILLVVAALVVSSLTVRVFVAVFVVTEVVLMDKCDSGACSVDDDLRCNLNFSLAIDLGALDVVVVVVGVAIIDLVVFVVGARGILWLEDKLADNLFVVTATCGSEGDETVECTSSGSEPWRPFRL
jgi:hypothetical protein